MHRHLDLCSGIGGFALGLEATGYFETVAFCDIDADARKVLRKNWPDVPIFEDIKDINREQLRAAGLTGISVVTGGIPCQPFSVIGKQGGAEDDRSLWPEMFRIVRELHPAWVVVENVIGFIDMALDEVISDLESLGYAVQSFIISSASVGAIHLRERVWVLAHAAGVGTQGLQFELGQPETDRPARPDSAGHSVGHAIGRDLDAGSTETQDGGRAEHRLEQTLRWPSEPAFRGADDGIPARLDKSRIKALGNAVSPQIPYQLGLAMKATDRCATTGESYE